MSVLSTLNFWRTSAPTHAYGREGFFKNGADVAVKLSIALGSVLVLMLAYYFDSQHRAIHMMWHNAILRPLLVFGGSYAFSTAVWSFWRFYLAMRYKPVPTVHPSRLPKITICVPAFNEGALVGETIRHLASATYPKDKIEIIVADDGSTDDTWLHIKRAADEVSSSVKILPLHFNQNRGKRWVLWEGFRRATGEIFVTVDSDSLIERDALMAVVSPLVEDPRVGGVAGNVRVLNREDGLIPRMLAVRYVMTFDYKRAAQSMMSGGGVLCCAGALAAYRRSAVLPILDQWLHQTYMGGHARAGEDHAMTNFILSQGHAVRYQRTARVYTKSPTTYTGLAKMFLRWGRSNVRESVHTGSYLFTGFAPWEKLGMKYNYLHAALGLLLPYVFLVAGLILSVVYPAIFGLKLLAACVTGGLFSLAFFAIRERSSEAVFAIVYGFFAMLPLGWVWPYALLTSHKSVWMTRTAAPKAKAVPSAAVVPKTRPALSAALEMPLQSVGIAS